MTDRLVDGAHDAWQGVAGVPAAKVFAGYRDEIARANAIITATHADAAPAWWPGDVFGEWRLADLRDVLLHVITETACHAGHLDAARELLDGRAWRIVRG